jgi:hypothetical protein
VIDPDGGIRVTLALEQLVLGLPTVWSPDGTMLMAFLPESASGYPEGIVLLRASGTEPVVVAAIPAELSTSGTASWQRLAP